MPEIMSVNQSKLTVTQIEPTFLQLRQDIQVLEFIKL